MVKYIFMDGITAKDVAKVFYFVFGKTMAYLILLILTENHYMWSNSRNN